MGKLTNQDHSALSPLALPEVPKAACHAEVPMKHHLARFSMILFIESEFIRVWVSAFNTGLLAGLLCHHLPELFSPLFLFPWQYLHCPCEINAWVPPSNQYFSPTPTARADQVQKQANKKTTSWSCIMFTNEQLWWICTPGKVSGMYQTWYDSFRRHHFH